MKSIAAIQTKSSLAKNHRGKTSDPISNCLLNEYTQAIGYLNSLAGTRFNPLAAGTLRLLTILFTKGYSLDDIKAVVQFKVIEWQNVPAMKRYLRPNTLFDFANFQRYHIEVLETKNPRS